jgi:Domain of unknown function (DUF5664)
MTNAKTALPNPKDLLGAKKVPFTCFPAAGQIHGSMAMEDGEYKYGFMNWREHPVRARIYIDAMKRHIAAWEDGEETAEDSLIHHLGHVIACAAILLDAQEVGNLIDDRSKSGKTAALLNRMSEILKKKQAVRKSTFVKAAPNVDAHAYSGGLSPIPAQAVSSTSVTVPVWMDVGNRTDNLQNDSGRYASDVSTSRFQSPLKTGKEQGDGSGF